MVWRGSTHGVADAQHTCPMARASTTTDVRTVMSTERPQGTMQRTLVPCVHFSCPRPTSAMSYCTVGQRTLESSTRL